MQTVLCQEGDRFFMFQKFTMILIVVWLLVLGCSSKEMVTEKDVIGASSVEILQTTTDQIANSNFDLLGKYMESGDYYIIPKGIKIKILQTRDNKYVKCLILNGKYIEEEFWTFKLSFDHGSEIPFDLIISK